MKKWLKYLFVLLLGMGGYTPCIHGQTTSDEQEYQKFRKMGEYSMSEGEYEKARKLLRVCLTLPKYEEDTQVKKIIEDCNAVIIAQQRYEKALQGNEDIMPALQELLKLNILSPKDRFFRTRATQKIEQKADEYLKMGNVENATKLFGLAYELTPVAGLGFKLEQADKQYVAKYNKSSLSYLYFVRKKQNKPSSDLVVADSDEYAQIIKAADEALKNGNYDLARRKYVAATQVPSHENDKYAEEQTNNATRLFRLSKQLEERQAPNDSRGKLLYAREALALHATIPGLKQQAAQAAEAVGDEMLGKGLFADAKKYYEEAARYGATNMAEKITQATQKVAEKRQENEKLGQIQRAPATPKKESRSRNRTNNPVLGVAVVTESHFVFPLLRNGNNKVSAPPQITFAGGGQLILFPAKILSATVGIHYLPIKIMTTNSPKTARLENFDLKLLQIPVGGRFLKSLGDTDFNLNLHAGATLNLPQKISYTNYNMDITTTELSMLYKQTLGFYGGVGLSRTLSERRSISLMLNYQRTDNLLNLDYKDTATNRSRASMALQGVSIQLIFKVF